MHTHIYTYVYAHLHAHTLYRSLSLIFFVFPSSSALPLISRLPLSLSSRLGPRFKNRPPFPLQWPLDRSSLCLSFRKPIPDISHSLYLLSPFLFLPSSSLFISHCVPPRAFVASRRTAVRYTRCGALTLAPRPPSSAATHYLAMVNPDLLFIYLATCAALLFGFGACTRAVARAFAALALDRTPPPCSRVRSRSHGYPIHIYPLSSLAL